MKLDRLTWLPLISSNFNRKNKPLVPPILILLCCSLVLMLLFLIADSFTVNQAMILGVAGSTIFAISVFFLTSTNAAKHNFEEAKNTARVFTQILDHIDNELSRVSNGDFHHINYPQNWLTMYTNIAAYLEYDYLSVLIREFAFVDAVNELLLSKPKEVARKISAYRSSSFDRWNDFHILDVRLNIYQFSMDQKEFEHWSKRKDYREFYDDFMRNYSNTVHEITIDYLKSRNGQCDEDEASQFVLSQLKNTPEIANKYKLNLKPNREVLLLVFHIHLDADKESNYSLCWGELTLNKD